MPTGSLRSGSLDTKSPAGRASTFPPSPGPGEPVTPPSKAGRRSFWDMLVMGEREVVKLISAFLPASCLPSLFPGGPAPELLLYETTLSLRQECTERGMFSFIYR